MTETDLNRLKKISLKVAAERSFHQLPEERVYYKIKF